MEDMHVDIETYSCVDLSKSGHYRYAEDPSTHITLFSCAFGNGPVQTVDLLHGEVLPDGIRQALVDPRVTKIAHHAPFERTNIEQNLGIPCDPRQWSCTKVKALSLGRPGGLFALSRELNLEHQKLAEGADLIQVLCTPKFGGPNSPLNSQLWPRFKFYNARDVEAEREACQVMRRTMPDDPQERENWAIDQAINDAGLPIDVEFVKSAADMWARLYAVLERELQSITKLSNPNSNPQFLEYLKRNKVYVEDMKADTIKVLLVKGGLSEEVTRAISLKAQLSLSSNAKYQSLLDCVGLDGRARGLFQFHGAERTGRWTGQIFQPQNLARGILKREDILMLARSIVMEGDLDMLLTLWSNPSAVLSSLIRSSIRAPSGKKLVVADYSSIEPAMMAWSSQDSALNRVFSQKLDLYKDFAQDLYGVSYDAVTKPQRTVTKPAVLGGFYGMSGGTLALYAARMGVNLSEEEAAKHVAKLRARYVGVPRFWWRMGGAANRAVSTRSVQDCYPVWFDGTNPEYLFMVLPSGRRLSYCNPVVTQGENIEYLGTKASKRMTLNTYSSKLVENQIQAISRDVLAYGLRVAFQEGIDVVGHIHDEPIALADEDDDTTLDRLTQVLHARPEWCRDAFISGKGWQGEYYKKD